MKPLPICGLYTYDPRVQRNKVSYECLSVDFVASRKLEVLLSEWDVSHQRVYSPPHCIEIWQYPFIHLGGERGSERAKCLGLEHNAIPLVMALQCKVFWFLAELRCLIYCTMYTGCAYKILLSSLFKNQL